MNYKISTGIFATTTMVFAIAFGVTFTMLQSQPEMGFPGGDFPRGDSMGGEFGMPPFEEGEFPGGQFCECDSEDDESTEDTEQAL